MTLASVTFADVPMNRITELHVEAWLKSMTKPGPKRKSGLAASTRRTRYNYVRMAFLAAVKARVIRQDPTSGITPHGRRSRRGGSRSRRPSRSTRRWSKLRHISIPSSPRVRLLASAWARQRASSWATSISYDEPCPSGGRSKAK